MAKKRVEETPDMENVSLDLESAPTPIVQEIKKEVPIQEEIISRVIPKQEESDGLINCLRNEKIIVRFIPRPTSMVQNPKHVLYGGMADTAKRSFVVPLLSNGAYKNVLTDSEKAFLEHVMGLEYNALSVYRKKDNFWDSSNPMGVGRVILHKQDNYLDLSQPIDYIKYKVLLANSDYIAPSLQALEDKPKATYQFVIISENAEVSANLSKMDTIQRCYMEYGKVEEDIETLKVIVELMEGRPLGPKTKEDYLKSKINDYIQSNPRLFLKTIKDELLPAKVLIRRCVEAGLIGKKNDSYYLRQDGSPLCEINEDSTLNNAARYLSSIKHQELKYTLEAKLKQ